MIVIEVFRFSIGRLNRIKINRMYSTGPRWAGQNRPTLTGMGSEHYKQEAESI
jgi:hypothetical protein